jgi:hypothetical protein
MVPADVQLFEDRVETKPSDKGDATARHTGETRVKKNKLFNIQLQT